MPDGVQQHQQIRVALGRTAEEGAQDAPLTRLAQKLCSRGIQILGMTGENVRRGGHVRIFVPQDQLEKAERAVREARLEPDRIGASEHELTNRWCTFAEIARNPDFDAFLVGCDASGRLFVQLTNE